MGQNRLRSDFDMWEAQENNSPQAPSKAYRMKIAEGCIEGYTDGIEAVKQSIYKILNTERFEHIMYGEDYGIETVDLYGQEISYVCSELERRICEALTWDDRIDRVDEFYFDVSQKGTIKVSFTVHTSFGDIKGAFKNQTSLEA